MGADAGELDHRRAAADDGEIADRAVTGQHDVVGEDDAVADMAVVADVRVGEKGAAVADGGRHAAAFGARIEGHALADHAVAADGQRRRLAVIFEILRLVADGRERKDARARADGGAAGDDDVAEQLDAVAERHVGADDAVGADLDPRAELGTRLDDCRRVRGHLTHACLPQTRGPRRCQRAWR